MKVIQLEIENVKRIVAVDITPQGNLVIVGGRNAQGKTSVLDAIAYALGGTKLICDRPVREGQAKAKVSVTLDGDPALLVTRTFTPEGGGSLTVSSPDGTARYASPQKLLDALVGRLTFDPLDFARQEARKQAETLKNLVGLDFTDLEAKRRKLYEDRTIAGRDVAGRKGQIEAMPSFPDAPAQEVSVTALAKELQAANDENRKNEAIRQHGEAIRTELGTITQKMEHAIKQIMLWEGQLNLLKEQGATATKRLESAQANVNKLKDIDTKAIEQKIGDAEQVNGKVRANKAKANMEARFVEAKADYDNLTAAIDALDAEKAKALSAVRFPIEGLTFAEDGVMFNSLPFAQCSSAEQLRISVAMGLAMNPKLRVLLIRDGSLLDADNLKMVADMAQKADAQVWLERVGEGTECSVIISQGKVEDIIVEKDGDQFCAHYRDFVNLQDSPAGFGETEEKAKVALRKQTVQEETVSAPAPEPEKVEAK